MQPLRTARHLVRLVLAWFVLSLGVAMASPVVQPQALELVCTSSGAFKVLLKGEDGVKEVSSHTLDCPLCAHAGSPPPLPRGTAEPAQPLAHVLQPIAAAHIAWLTAAPLPARGPPQA